MRNKYDHIRSDFSVTVVLLLLTLFGCEEKQEQQHSSDAHPCLTLTARGVQQIRAQLGSVPLFDQTFEEAIGEVDKELKASIEVPVPKHIAGGYTHERHKQNFFVMKKAGALYQITGDEKYARYVKDMLLAYAKLYPSLGLHPADRSYAPGKLFWQCLNDANWLVYTSQAYDCIYDYLTAEERALLESDLFRPFAEFLSVQNPRFFNSIHNHSTWANAGVGMIGLVMKDSVLVNRALYGLEGHRQNSDRAGFLAQLDLLFSPDGYYAEGPYYQRYALSPFVLFAQSLANSQPTLEIFKYRDSVLKKSVHALINLTDEDGEFYPINDAQKGMSYHSRELILAVDVIYALAGQDPELLSIAADQNKVSLDDAGLKTALGLKDGLSRPFEKQSVELTDGSDGKGGGIGVLRANSNSQQTEVVMKYTGQGMGHGHFDRLSFSMYANGEEIIQDYGMVRFVNIEQKAGGAYLPENSSFAKQTIAHNTVVVDERSNFDGNVKVANRYHSNAFLFDGDDENLQVMIATDTNAYDKVSLQRAIALVKDEAFENPLVVDLTLAHSFDLHQYDLPYYYVGQMISTSWDYKKEDQLKPLGKSNGYQHLWKEAQAVSDQSYEQFTWLSNNRFYTLTTLLADQAIFARTGANDPNFNLRNDPVLILRTDPKHTGIFISLIEAHGSYSPVSERSKNSYSNISEATVIWLDKNYIILRIGTHSGENIRILMAYNVKDEQAKHEVTVVDGETYRWKGPLYLTKEEIKN